MYTFGYWLTDQMRARRISSVSQLARETGLDSGRVSDWVVGRAQPTEVEAARLARYLGVPFGRIGVFVDDSAHADRRWA